MKFFIDIESIFCHILVLQEYLTQAGSRILLKRVLWGMKVAALSINSHEQTQ